MRTMLSGRPYRGSAHDAGRLLLGEMYREATGEEMPPLAVTEFGKPYFPGGTLHFSITHTKCHVFCALSTRNVGIDAEELTRQIDPRLAQRILSPEELTQYRSAQDRNLALLTFWVLKEAYGKFLGKGLSYPLKSTRFSLNDPKIQIIDGCVLAVWEENNHAF